MSAERPHATAAARGGDFASHHRLQVLSAFALVIGVISSAGAALLLAAIRLFTNLFFFQSLSLASHSPAGHRLGAWVILVPAIGGVIIGLMALWHREDPWPWHSGGARSHSIVCRSTGCGGPPSADWSSALAVISSRARSGSATP